MRRKWSSGACVRPVRRRVAPRPERNITRRNGSDRNTRQADDDRCRLRAGPRVLLRGRAPRPSRRELQADPGELAEGPGAQLQQGWRHARRQRLRKRSWKFRATRKPWCTIGAVAYLLWFNAPIPGHPAGAPARSCPRRNSTDGTLLLPGQHRCPIGAVTGAGAGADAGCQGGRAGLTGHGESPDRGCRSPRRRQRRAPRTYFPANQPQSPMNAPIRGDRFSSHRTSERIETPGVRTDGFTS